MSIAFVFFLQDYPWDSGIKDYIKQPTIVTKLSNATEADILYEYLKEQVFQLIVDPYSTEKGIGYVEPIKSNMDLFDFYFYVEFGEVENRDMDYSDFRNYLNTIDGCKADIGIFFVPASVRSFAVKTAPEEETTASYEAVRNGYIITPFEIKRLGFGKYEINSIKKGEDGYGGRRVIIHEMGHIFGLRDEYVEPSKGSRAAYPNCAPNKETALSWWGSFVDLGKGSFKISKDGYKGCSYIKSNIRPNENTIMNYHLKVKDSDLSRAYGLVNEVFIERILNKFRNAGNMERESLYNFILNNLDKTA